MNRLLTKPLSKKAVLNERPNSAHQVLQSRVHRSSLSSNPVVANPALHDMGTSTSPMKFEDFDMTTVPIQTMTFKSSKPTTSQRRRRVLVVKYLGKQNELAKVPVKGSNRSLLKFFDVATKNTARGQQNTSRGSTSSRPVTCKSQGPVHKRVFSEVNLEYPAGSRLFDICEVLSITKGEINFKQLKLRR